MKCTLALIAIFIIALRPLVTIAQTQKDYYAAAKNKDFSKLFQPKSATQEIEGQKTTIQIPEPIGYIGQNYQRFYIHFITVTKNPDSPYQYLITGKTKVHSNVCGFQGKITIKKSTIFQDTLHKEYKQGTLSGTFIFEEDSLQLGSGTFTGTFTSKWCATKNGIIQYNALESYSDGYRNNQFSGTHEQYTKKESIKPSESQPKARRFVRKCNWGDFRIPDSRALDMGAGDFSPSSDYLKFGWTSYSEAFWSDDSDIAKKARTAEELRWWE